MHDVTLEHTVDRPMEEALVIFAGPAHRWLPVLPGPGERSWRTETKEGLVRVKLVLVAGRVVNRGDGERWRSLTIEPDPTARTAFLTAGLTPTLRGNLGLVPAQQGTAALRFEGSTESRSWATTSLERLLVGDRLSHSGVHNLLGDIARCLASADVEGRDEPGG